MAVSKRVARRKHLTVPRDLARIARHKERLNAPEVVSRKDPEQVDSDNQRLDEWERKTKNALVVLSLQENDGITMLLQKMDEELLSIDESLRMNRPKSLSNEGAMEYAQMQYALIGKRELWEWFRGFFTDAHRDLKEVREDLDLQEEEEETAPGY